MKTRKYAKTVKSILLLAWMGFASTASASLTAELGGQVVYDSVHNLTWMADSNLAMSNNFGVGGINPDGTMTLYTALNWISAMNAANYLGYSDWRLPSALKSDGSDPCGPGYNCTDSEMGGLFYGDINSGLGGVAGSSILSTHNSNLSLFSNPVWQLYWSSTPWPPTAYWTFNFWAGLQTGGDTGLDFRAWAVRTGDSAPVPLPAAFWLFGFALAGLIGFGRRNNR